MARKKRKPPRGTPKRPPRSRVRPEGEPELPDRRALEGAMRDLLGDLIGPRDETPLSQAQNVMYEAGGAHDPEGRVKAARKALDLSPDWADAYVVRAEEARSRKDARELFEKGV